jgi:putative transposase
MLQMVSTQIEGAEKSLIERSKKGHKTGQLRFARYNEFRTFTYSQSGFKLNNNKLFLSKIGDIRIKKHRDTSDNIKQVIVTKSKSGKWHACITCELVKMNPPKIDFLKSVGIDVGIKSFAYDSDKHSMSNPLNLKKMLKPLARAQRKVSRRVKGSNNRLKAIRHLQRIHERIVNRRKDFQHKLSSIYANHYDVIFVEDLQLTNMVKNHKLACSIMDSSWGAFLQKLEYKCKLLIKIPARNTTINCSRCGNKVPKSLAVRIHRCNKCNLVINRDYNASINILQKGLKIFSQDKLPQELWEVTSVEISMRSVKQKVNTFRRW